MPKDHRFSQCAQFGDDYEVLSCKTPQLEPITRAFIRNMNRVRGIGMLPLNLTAIAIINEAARIEAVINKKLPLHDPRISHPEHPSFDEALFSGVDTERKRLLEQWMQAWGGTQAFGQRATMAGMYGMNAIIDGNEEQSWDAVQATMAAMLIGLWTAFEALAQDTWITAVNSRPSPLADNVMSVPDAALKTGNTAKSVSYAHFIGSTYDFSRTMGSLLFAERKVDFQSLKTIRAAYKVAFAGELEAIFEEYETDLYRLETMRNLFVHKGGLVDRKFIGRMGNEPYMKDTEGRSLVVNGEYVAAKANAISACSTKLIQAVDKWLSEHLGESQKESADQ